MNAVQLSLKGPEHGGAVVETALLSLLMVPILLYAMFFSDIALVNIKTLEASRYAAWELTAMQITNYDTSTHDLNSKARTRKDSETNLTLLEEVKARWGDDMNGATSANEKLALGETNGIYNEKLSGLSITELDVPEDSKLITISDGLLFSEDKPVSTEESSQVGSSGNGSFLDSFLQKLLSYGGKGSNSLYDYFGFNKNGFPAVSYSMKVKLHYAAPIFAKSGGLMPENMMPTFKSTQKMAVDSWDLKYGGNVDFGPTPPSSSTPGYGYYKQVERMMFAGMFSKNGLGSVLNLGGDNSVMQKISDAITKNFRLPWKPVVRSYAMKTIAGKASGCASGQKNIKGCVSFDDAAAYSGVGGPPKTFYTNPYKNTYTEGENSPYLQVYARQSPDPKEQSASDANTGYYLGCGKAQMIDRSKCWTD